VKLSTADAKVIGARADPPWVFGSSRFCPCGRQRHSLRPQGIDILTFDCFGVREFNERGEHGKAACVCLPLQPFQVHRNELRGQCPLLFTL
jgi:hypothetical protein